MSDSDIEEEPYSPSVMKADSKGNIEFLPLGKAEIANAVAKMHKRGKDDGTIVMLMASELGRLGRNLVMLEEMMSVLIHKTDNLDERLTAVETKSKALDGLYNTLEYEMREMFRSTETQMGLIDSRLDEVMSKLEDIQCKVIEAESSIRSLWDNVD